MADDDKLGALIRAERSSTGLRGEELAERCRLVLEKRTVEELLDLFHPLLYAYVLQVERAEVRQVERQGRQRRTESLTPASALAPAVVDEEDDDEEDGPLVVEPATEEEPAVADDDVDEVTRAARRKWGHLNGRTFRLGGVYIDWLDATKEQHRSYALMLTGKIEGLRKTRSEHEEAAADIGSASCLRDLVKLPHPPAAA